MFAFVCFADISKKRPYELDGKIDDGRFLIHQDFRLVDHASQLYVIFCSPSINVSLSCYMFCLVLGGGDEIATKRQAAEGNGCWYLVCSSFFSSVFASEEEEKSME